MAKKQIPANNLPPIKLNSGLTGIKDVGPGIQTGIATPDPTLLRTADIPSEYRDAFVSTPAGKSLSEKQLQYQSAENQTAFGNLT